MTDWDCIAVAYSLPLLATPLRARRRPSPAPLPPLFRHYIPLHVLVFGPTPYLPGGVGGLSSGGSVIWSPRQPRPTDQPTQISKKNSPGKNEIYKLGGK